MNRDTAIKKVGEDAPSWLVDLAQKGDDSLTNVRQYRQLARARVLQGLSDPDLKAKHGEGAVLLQPGGGFVVGADEPFNFVPLFLFTEFVKWADVRDKNQNAVVDRTFDPKGEIALKSRDVKRRQSETYAGGSPDNPFRYRYVEHLNFVGVIYDAEHPLNMQPLTISFERGEFVQGTNFCSAIAMRRVGGHTAPLWSQVWEFRTRLRNRKGYRWHGFDFSTPEVPFIAQEEVDTFRALHQELADQYAEKILMVDRDGDDTDEVIVNDAATPM